MLKKFASVMVHLLCLAGVVAIAAYWAVRIFTPAPTAAPPPLPPPPLRDPDANAAARMFGKVEVAQAAVAANIQALGAFAAGKDSSAVLVVDGRPPRGRRAAEPEWSAGSAAAAAPGGRPQRGGAGTEFLPAGQHPDRAHGQRCARGGAAHARPAAGNAAVWDSEPAAGAVASEPGDGTP